MKGRVFWALVGSVLLHLVLIGWMCWSGPMGRLMVRPIAERVDATAVIQVRLLPAGSPSLSAAFGAPLPRAPTAAPASAVARRVPRPALETRSQKVAQPVAEDGHPVGTAPEGKVSSEEGAPEKPARHKPLALELSAKGFSHGLGATTLQTRPTPDRLRDALQPEGPVAIQETRGAMGERRATVTTPWGRYCMRERRSAGPYDARRDQGMYSVTCPDG